MERRVFEISLLDLQGCVRENRCSGKSRRQGRWAGAFLSNSWKGEIPSSFTNKELAEIWLRIELEQEQEI